MKLESSTLFVNTGRKPLPAMQKKKKNNKNTIALIICIAIIAVLCVFVGSIARLWLSYNQETKSPKVQETAKHEVKETKPKIEKEPEKKPEVKTKKETKKPNSSMGTPSTASKSADKAFADLDGTYSYGLYNLNDGYTYINNTEKIYNSAAMGAFLVEYVSNAIYIGQFDYYTDVAGYLGRDLMTSAFSGGSVEAANLLIQHFGAEKLNAYFASKGYTNTVFAGGIGSGMESYTTSEDLIKLMRKMYDNTTFFPYSDMYSKMRVNSVDNKIALSLPAGSAVANLSFETADETFDGGIITTPSGSFVFVAMASDCDINSANTSISNAVNAICASMAKEETE